MNSLSRYLSACIVAIAALVIGASPVLAHGSSSGGSSSAASGFAVLSTEAGAVTCTTSTITGDVGSAGAAASVTQTGCTINGTVVAPISADVITAFNTAYAALALPACDQVFTAADTLAGLTLAPGVYCFDAAATLTGTLTLAGTASDTWLFRVGTGGTGALTGTSLSVVMDGGGLACNVSWRVAEAVTMTDSNLQGKVLAGAAITITGGTLTGGALAKAAVTLTDTVVTGCPGIAVPDDHGDKDHGDKDHGDKDHGDKDHGDKDRGDKDRGDKDRGDKDRGDKDRGDKDRGNKDRGDIGRGDSGRGDSGRGDIGRSDEDRSDKDRGGSGRSVSAIRGGGR